MMTSNAVLTHDDLKVYPSLMAERPSGKTSSRYSFIPTTRVIEQFAAMNFYPMFVKESRANDEKMGYQGHLIRFRQAGAMAVGLDQLFPEIVLTNSHDAGTSFRLMAGIFRLVCTNGMVVGEGLGGSIRINHVGYTDQAVREAVATMGDRLPRVMNRVEEFKNLEMTPDDAGVYAVHALGIKYGENVLEERDLDPYALMIPKRVNDKKPTLWNAYNTVQEKLVETGEAVETKEMKRSRWNWKTKQYTNLKQVYTKPITGPAANVRVNQALWELTEDFDKRLKETGHVKPGEVEKMLKYFQEKREEHRAEKIAKRAA